MSDNAFEILNDSVIGLEGVTVSRMNVCSYHMHTHLYYELLLYEPFDGLIKINEREFAITKPTAVLIAPGDFHSTELSGKASPVMKMQCDATKLDQSYPTAILPADHNHGMIKQLFDTGAKYWRQKDYLLAVVRMAVAEIAFHGQVLPDTVTGKSMLVSKTMQYINRNFRGEATLCEAADMLHISAQYLSGLFSRTVGITFQSYLIEKRLSAAASLLKSGKCSVTEACYECGYTNLSHFIRCFKNKYHVSPGAFCKRYRHDSTDF